MPVHPDPPRWEGAKSFVNAHVEWTRLSRGGKHKLTTEEHKRVNAIVGSSFSSPIFNTLCIKQNGGCMHTPNGHQNHFWASVNDAIKEKMRGCAWQVQVSSICNELAIKLKEVETKIKQLGNDASTRTIKSKLRALRKKSKSVSDEREKEQLNTQQEELREQLRDRSDQTDVGTYNLIHEGLKEFEAVLKAGIKKNDLKRPQSDLQYVMWKAVETRAGGRLDPKQSGMDQTNASGLKSVRNCAKVFEALLGMYPPTDVVDL